MTSGNRTPELNAEYHRTYNAKPEAKELHRQAERRRRDRLAAERPEQVVEPPVPVVLRTRNVVIAEFNYMLNQAKVNDWSPRCEGKPERYVLYETVPTAEYAESICVGCPMQALCLERATVTHQGWGIWGGVAFVDGKPYTGSLRQKRMEAA